MLNVTVLRLMGKACRAQACVEHGSGPPNSGGSEQILADEWMQWVSDESSDIAQPTHTHLHWDPLTARSWPHASAHSTQCSFACVEKFCHELGTVSIHSILSTMKLVRSLQSPPSFGLGVFGALSDRTTRRCRAVSAIVANLVCPIFS